jgi:hypothetical protein
MDTAYNKQDTQSTIFFDSVSYLLYALNMAKKLIALRVKEKDLKALEKIAKREQESVSETIRRAILEFLKKDAR